MRRVAIIQARLGSTRLPGKVLADLAGKPMLEQQLARMKRASFDDIVVATPDDDIITLARRAGVRWFKGSETDVLERYVLAARDAKAEQVIRITADCPLIDPSICNAVMALCEDCDYASNILQRTFPKGLDTEALFVDVLERTHRLAKSQAAREHVTWHIYKEAPERHVLKSYTWPQDFSHLRWTVDTPDDLTRVRALVERAGTDDDWLSYTRLE